MSKSVIPYLRSEPLWYHVSLGSYHIGASSGQCWRCSMNTKNACCLSRHSGLNICTPRSFQAIDSPPPSSSSLSLQSISPTSHHLFSLSCQFPSLSSYAVSPVGRELSGWQGVSPTPLTAHYSLIPRPFSSFFPIFHTSTKAHAHTYAMISIACPNNILEECKYQSSISPFSHYMLVCVCLARRSTITQQSMCALAVEVCVFLC